MSADPFELLGVERRPWLDAGTVREAFQRRARVLHPDAAGGDAERFAELNAAAVAVGDPVSRLRVLAGAGGGTGAGGGQDFEFGFKVGAGLRKADALARRLSKAGTPLQRALLAAECAGMQRALGELAQTVEDGMEGAMGRLRELDGRWPEVEPEELRGLADELVFLGKWRREIRERMLEVRAG